MKSYIFGLILLVLSGASSTWAADSLIWTCAPQDLFGGLWDVRIFRTDIGLQAKTSYLHDLVDLVPTNVPPLEQKIDIKDSLTGDSIEYAGAEFSFVVYPTRKPQSNPFRWDSTAVAAEAINVRFATNAILTDRPYACKPKE